MKKVGPLSSHFSPVSNAPLPHVGGLWHLLMSNWQFDWQDKVPPMYVEISEHCLLPKSVPSHCSPGLIVPSLHVPPENPEQLAVLILQLASHFKFPPLKSLLYCEHCPLNGNELVSHCSVFVSTTPLLHDDFGVHPLVSRKQLYWPHVIDPPANPRSVHVFGILPASQCSFVFITLLLHDVGVVQALVSYWQFLQLNVPPMKLLKS